MSEWEPGLEIVFPWGGRHRRRDLGGRVPFHSWELQIYPWRSHLLRNGESRALSRQARFWDWGAEGREAISPHNQEGSGSQRQVRLPRTMKIKSDRVNICRGECGAGGGEGD